ncbi:hypothetical protein BKA63DRAFT_198736 [Paraphoma chrysanthemicola]|nr:hypothetical protein BKA63DRAFT_198736 [Paraphoma chrysanthemicola]
MTTMTLMMTGSIILMEYSPVVASETMVLSAALDLIGKASHSSLASCADELDQANLAIAHALLLLKRSNIKAGNHELDSFAGEMTDAITSQDTSAQTQPTSIETKNAPEKYKALICRPENVIAQFVQKLVTSRLMGSDRRDEQNDLRRAIIANSPTLYKCLPQ